MTCPETHSGLHRRQPGLPGPAPLTARPALSGTPVSVSSAQEYAAPQESSLLVFSSLMTSASAFLSTCPGQLLFPLPALVSDQLRPWRAHEGTRPMPLTHSSLVGEPAPTSPGCITCSEPTLAEGLPSSNEGITWTERRMR